MEQEGVCWLLGWEIKTGRNNSASSWHGSRGRLLEGVMVREAEKQLITTDKAHEAVGKGACQSPIVSPGPHASPRSHAAIDSRPWTGSKGKARGIMGDASALVALAVIDKAPGWEDRSPSDNGSNMSSS
ncbi:Hypothetical protein SMAX5B_019214 [Scophthalmus maximus]|uniref:Uncharacterized protein n=1 Tax=Scophthalmus maximus TaxID=52904 RepID=A0A2U9C7H4_SCOMX|nr:Hypothetical protein SMAX5B_019214 [Scophthalmus maximus]